LTAAAVADAQKDALVQALRLATRPDRREAARVTTRRKAPPNRCRSVAEDAIVRVLLPLEERLIVLLLLLVPLALAAAASSNVPS